MTAPPAREPSSHALVGAVLVGAVLLTFSPALYADFVRFDDPDLVLANPHIRSFSADNLRWMFTASVNGHYHPLTWLSFALDYQLWGSNPRGYHITNIALHALSTLLVYALALRVLGCSSPNAPRAPAAALAAGFFAVHPLRVESVAWVTERRDVLSMALLLGAALAYVGAAARVRGADPPRPLWAPPARSLYILSIALLALSLLSKAWGMTFFAVLLILDWTALGRSSPPDRTRRWPLLVEKLPMLLLGMGAAAMAARAQSSGHAMKTLAAWGAPQRAAQALYGLWFYVEKTIWPSKLAAMYEIPDRLDPFAPRFLVAYAGVAALAAIVVVAGRRWRAVWGAALAYVIIVLPVLGIAQSGDQLVADRYSYVASVPLALLMAGLLRRLLEHPDGGVPRAASIVAGLWVCVLAALSWIQTDTWHDTESLWRRAAAVSPGPLTFELLGEECYLQNKPQEAALWLQRSLDESPGNGQARYLLGLSLAQMGDYAAAAAQVEQAIPTMRQPYMGHGALGVLYANNLGRPREAEAAFRAALESVEERTRAGRPPEEGAALYLALGALLKKQGRADEARPLFEKAAAFEETHAIATKELQELGAPPK